MRTGRLPRCVTPKKLLSSLLYARVYHSGTTFYNSFAKHRTPNNGQDIHYSHKSQPYWRGDTQRNIPAPKTRPSSSWSATKCDTDIRRPGNAPLLSSPWTTLLAFPTLFGVLRLGFHPVPVSLVSTRHGCPPLL